ncbi:MAG: hypothetical protein ACI8ZB_000372 [Desulforhopalus sp.]|jgi:hypothetical protein
MHKHFLVTVSFDSADLTGVRFLCSFFQKLSEHQVTLFHICRLDSNDMNATLMEMWDKPDDRIHGRPTVGAQRALDKARTMLAESSMCIDQLITKTFAERYGKVKDILNEGEQGLYDAIILGKRASYTLQSFFERAADETAQKIIEESRLTTPVWICPEPDRDQKNVLVCIDGSENALRAVDHAGYILANQPQHSITLFNVQNGHGLDLDKIFADARKALAEHNIADSRIHTDTSWGVNVSGTIMGYAEKGRFASIAFGLNGVDQGLLKSFKFAGGTAASLIEKTNKVSLWCCP